MPNWFVRPTLVLATLLSGAAPGMAQAVAPLGANADVGSFWPLVVPNAAVALLGVGWLLLMARRRG